MASDRLILPRGSIVRKNRLKVIFAIALSWTVVDLAFFSLRAATGNVADKYTDGMQSSIKALLIRELNVFIVSLIMGYFLVAILRNFLRNSSLWYNLFIKTLLLVAVAIVMNFLIHITYYLLIKDHALNYIVVNFFEKTFSMKWLLLKMPEWILLFLLTQMAIEINEKYSPGVFFDIMVGRYLQPKEENRIIMFIDLRNSTPIAEKLGNKEYFKFIRDFIFAVSAGVMEHEGRIYQYVGDEIVVWWPSSSQNARQSINAIIELRKVLNANANTFKRRHDIIPEYKAGVHTGVVTVGQIGIIKKDLIMSGDTINTAARIRSACTDLNEKFLVSKEMIDLLNMKDWQTESKGLIDLKGKNESLELFALKI